MKAFFKSLFLVSFFTYFFSACSPYYYQVYQTKPDKTMVVKENGVVYEDDYCWIEYNLWDDQGDSGFTFYNKTEDNITIDLEQSFYIANDIAYNYFLNRQVSSSRATQLKKKSQISSSKALANFYSPNLSYGTQFNYSSGTTATSMTGSSVARQEEKLVIIPPKTAKVITEYVIMNMPLRNCDLYRFPNKNQITTLNFDKENTPLDFKNRISYRLKDEAEVHIVENSFYISSVTNYPQAEIMEKANDKFCGQREHSSIKTFKSTPADQFYIKYKKINTQNKH